MRTILKYLITCCLLLSACFCFSRQNKTSGERRLVSGAEPSRTIDSLLTLLETGKEDTAKVILLNNLCWEYKTIGEYDSAFRYGEQALQLAKKLNFPIGIIDSYNNIGLIYKAQGNYEKALEEYSASLRISEELRNSTDELLAKAGKKGTASCYNNIGTVYYHQSIYDKALKNYFASLKIKEELGDKRGTASTYNNIGLIYADQSNYVKALDNYFASLNIVKQLGNQLGIAYLCNNIGNIYARKAELQQNSDSVRSNYEKALENHFTSLKIRKDIGDKQGIAASFSNIGNIYREQATNALIAGDTSNASNKYKMAIENHGASLKIRQEIGDQEGIAISYINIGKSYKELKQFEQAIAYMLRGLEFSRKIGALLRVKESYGNLANCFAQMNDYKNAYKYHQLYSNVKDSIFNEESSKQITEMQTKYETEKKEKEILLLKKDKEIQQSEAQRQKIIRNSFIGASLLALLLALVLFNRYQIKKKANHKLTEQNEQIRKQKELIEEQKQNMTDSIEYASYIQKAVLPSDVEFKEAFPDSFILFKPRDIVSGDFYWTAPLPPEGGFKITPLGEMESISHMAGIQNPPSGGRGAVLALGDCTGHGVPGAFMSMLCNALLNESVNDKHLTNPNEILEDVRKGIISALKQREGGGGSKDGMDCSLISFGFRVPSFGFDNPSALEIHTQLATCNTQLKLANANNPVYIVSSGVLTEIKADRQSVGFSYTPKPFTLHETELMKGDMVYMLSDGYEDQMGGEKESSKGGSAYSGKKFKNKRLKELFISIAGQPVDMQKNILEKTFEEWKGRREQTDDVTIIGIKV